MTVKLLSRDEDTIKVEISFHFNRSMFQSEHIIQDTLNKAGTLATEELLKRFDTDGSDIMIGNLKLTSKGQSSQRYQTPYGEATVARHVYQSSQGGKTYCPLEKQARTLLKATPRYAEQVSHKSAEMASTQVCKDMENNHHRHIPRSYIKKLSEAVASVVQTKEEDWTYKTPATLPDVRTVSIGLDGTCMLLCEEGYRQAMVGRLLCMTLRVNAYIQPMWQLSRPMGSNALKRA